MKNEESRWNEGVDFAKASGLRGALATVARKRHKSTINIDGNSGAGAPSWRG
ncbi:MAG: hypothetical protein HDR79_09370, partial [Bacteroides sp.]|nr:hypothetical protein [Bacteroides sp.]